MLKDNELVKINGGIKWTAIGIIGGLVTFIVGIIDGYFRPLRCN